MIGIASSQLEVKCWSIFTTKIALVLVDFYLHSIQITGEETPYPYNVILMNFGLWSGGFQLFEYFRWEISKASIYHVSNNKQLTVPAKKMIRIRVGDFYGQILTAHCEGEGNQVCERIVGY
eukprot:scaffold8676_cov139-Skeletonema_marinoi.AAC.6